MIQIQAGNSPVSTDELQHAVEIRGKKKPHVTITVYETWIKIQYKNQVGTITGVDYGYTVEVLRLLAISTQGASPIFCSSLAKINAILKIKSEPRALGISVCNPDTESGCISVLLIAKKNSWFRRNFTVCSHY